MVTLEIIKQIDAKLELLGIKMNSDIPLNNLNDEAFLSIVPFKTIESIKNAEEKFERKLVKFLLI